MGLSMLNSLRLSFVTQWKWLGLVFLGVSACAQNNESNGSTDAAEAEFSLAQIVLPAGFEIAEIADVPNARSMALGEDGTLYVASQRAGKVHAVRDLLGPAPEVLVVADELRYPNGVAVKDGDLYIAELSKILRVSDVGSTLDDPATPEILFDELLNDGLHGWKHIKFGPDGKLYIGIGAPCNICNEPEYGLVQRMNPDGSEIEVIARGVRNTVGFDWHPETDEFWFTDNNRDMMGDNKPPGELNRLSHVGEHFGFPFCHGADIVEPNEDFAALGTCADSKPPEQLLGPHVAPLGMVFYQGKQFPEEYRNQVFIAEHGSWNRSEKIGYRVTLVTLEGNRPVSYEPFAEGWLQGQTTKGRPVDVIVASDGSLLVSDDHAGKIYRIAYVGDANVN